MFRSSKSLLRSKAGKSKGTIIDIPGKPIEPTPIIISQPSNSQETNGSNREIVRGSDSEKSHSRQSTPIIPSSSRSQEKNSNNAINDSITAYNIQNDIQSETSPDAIIVNDDGGIIDVVNQAPQDVLTDVTLSPSKTRSNERQSAMNRTVSNADNVRDGTQRRSLQKFPTSPKIILSFTNDSVVESSPSSNTVTSQNNTTEVVDNEDAISQRVTVGESDVITEGSLVRSRQRKTTTTTNNSNSKKRTRSNNDDEQSEDSTAATSSSSKQSKRHKRSSSVASITSSTNTDGSSTTSIRKQRSKSRKPRATTRKQQSGKNRFKPWEDNPEDENPLDDSVVTMAELCKDLKRGRKSNTYKELEYAKYQKSQQKRRLRAVNNIREDEVEEGGEASTSQYLEGEEGDNIDPNNFGDNHQNEQNEDGIEQQNEDLNNDGSENYEEEYYNENGEWEQEGYYDEDGNWIQYENYDENEEYQQGENLEEVEEEIQQDENNENFNEHKPTLMKRRVFSSRSSRFVNTDGQYIVREGRDSRPRVYENDEGMEVIEEDKFSHIVNSFTYSKKPRKNERWTIDDTELFFKALSRWGTDFEIISRKIFDNRKSRDQVKNKYKRERKINPLRVYKALDTRIPIEPEELEIISRYTEELAAIQADNNTQEETTEVNQDDIVEGGSTGENQEAFDIELDGDHQEELGSVFSFDDYPDMITPIVEMDY